ncbi:EamA family transporter RarD [Corynebacterium sp. sy017]|uniref:EamA family transporter RarD n=1 Tax=unclassified Corynebacterium TaxID=2624378 RepID=UPI0011857724|nr:MULTISPECIES: EamA family transporter RarD [unclassified Corynebacterium]MBP3087940.1 EamA family transporter RarD [Corynebacterium sp. sy017]QDZ42903.1 EamA family transporter RarD [Corynebacterium sp. sy039]TSD92476.1 EamA family transporter RarD [Corynebacterium sp. SY003]
MVYGILAYLLWGIFPAYFPLLKPATALEVIAHRIVWTCVFMFILLLCTRRWQELRNASAKVWLRVAAASLLIATNWLVYVVAVNSGHVSEAALGYFINPLVSVILGMIFLGERLRFLQKIAIMISTLAVIILTLASSQPPILALLLAFSFGFYGLLKKGLPLSASASVAGETFVLTPLACGYLIFLALNGTGTFIQGGMTHSLLLISSGFITAIPLLLFGAATHKTQLSTIGMLQYITPSIQMLWAVIVVHEQLDVIRWLGFVIIWISVSLYLLDTFLFSRKQKRANSGEK